MKLLLLTVVITFSSTSFSQLHLNQITGYEFSNHYDINFDINQQEKELLADKKIKTRTKNIHLRDGKNSTEIETFDLHGNLVLYQRFNHKSELLSESKFTYNDKQQLIYVTYWYNQKQSYSYKRYDNDGNLTETRGYNSKGKYHGRYDYYNPQGKILTTQLFEKDSINPYKQLDYEYYEDLSLKSINYYENSKLKYTWSYECKSEGELETEKTTDTTLICIKEELDSAGNTIIWRQELNKKGDLEKVKRVKDQEGYLILTTHYNKDGRKTTETIHFKDGGILQAYFDKKGIVVRQREIIYNYQGDLIKSSHTGNKWYYYNWNSYTDGLVTTSTYMSRKNLRVTEYSYTYHP